MTVMQHSGVKKPLTWIIRQTPACLLHKHLNYSATPLEAWQAAHDTQLWPQDRHNSDVIWISWVTGKSTVCSTISTHQRKYQNPASLALVRGIHRWPVDSPHKGPLMWKIFPLDDVIMRKVVAELNIVHSSDCLLGVNNDVLVLMK